MQSTQVYGAGTTNHTGPFTIANSQPRNLTIQTKHGLIVINVETGAVSLPEGVPANVAASEFWKHVGPAHSTMVHDRIMKEADRLFQLRWEETLKTAFPKVLSEECLRAYRRGWEAGLKVGPNGEKYD